MCTIFLTMSMLSKNVPGYFLAYIISMTLFFGPLIISKLPSQYKNSIATTIQTLRDNDGIFYLKYL